MSDSLKHLEEIFPNLARAGYQPKSEKSADYNCIAYAAGDETQRWAGYREVDYYWPDGAREGFTLDALMSAFQSLGYSVCDTDAMETEFEKVALYVDKDGLWTHGAKQCEDGQWTSKLGSLEDIVHRTPEAIGGPEPAYGEVACYMRPTDGAYGDSRSMTLTAMELQFLSAWAREEWEPACYRLPAHRLQLSHGVRGASLLVLIKAWAKAEGKKDHEILEAAKNLDPTWPWSSPEEFRCRLDEANSHSASIAP